MWRIAWLRDWLSAGVATVLPGWFEVIWRDLTLMFCCLVGLLSGWWGDEARYK